MTEKTLSRTPLYERHVKAGGKMVPFAGYEMPIEYEGIMPEHRRVRSTMGLFDVSHMGEIEIKGPRALEFCQKVSCNDVSQLKPGKVQYSAILNHDGGILDDCTLYQFAENHYLFVVNAASREKIMTWFSGQAMEDVQIDDQSGRYALLALQGPKAHDLLSRIVRRDLTTVKFYEFIWSEIKGSAVLISRTGYTGEDGFELYIPTDSAAEIWDLLLDEGKEDGLAPIGLGARDTLRLEMGYLLYGSDMNEKVSPLEAGIGWIVKLDKGHFNGAEKLRIQKEEGVKRRIRAFELLDRGVPRAGYEILEKDTQIGEVTSGTFSPSLSKGIAMGFVASRFELGQEVLIQIRKKRVLARIKKPPFVEGSIKR